ncbi:MAG: hypothetical protein ACQET1_02780 [Gemmatimonadota bacterium]
MYSTCMFCNQALGRNEVIEHFPIGRRLSFDAEKGRLWVVCRKCERWNLTPIEERWEAIEDCERLYHGIRTRASTENVGLARHREGLELVRIGAPLRPEFAAWRYGDQFGRRRKKAIIVGVGAGAVLGTVLVAGAVTGAISGVFMGQFGNFFNLYRNGRTLVKVREEDGTLLKLKQPDLDKTRILSAGEADEWVIELKRGKLNRRWGGEDALRMANRIIPAINRSGGRKGVVQEAVREIEEAGHPTEFLRLASLTGIDGTGNLWKRSPGNGSWRAVKDKHLGLIGRLPVSSRMALEMALHEEQERRALQGELKVLEAAWKRAEEIAAISDDLLLPEGTSEFLAEHGTRNEPAPRRQAGGTPTGTLKPPR